MNETPQMRAAPPTLDTNPNSNKLIQQEESGIKTFTGGGLADSLAESISDIDSGVQNGDWNAVELATDGAIVALDVLGIIMNPFGELGKAAAGWLIEHISFLREGIEVITGDPEEIKALVKTWDEISKELDATAADYQTSLSGVSGWKGPAADVYRTTANNYIKTLKAASVQAKEAGEGVKMAGIGVAAVRGLVFDMIAEFVGKLIGKLIVAGLTAIFTFGASAAAMIASAIADACILAKRIFSRLKKLVSALEAMGKRVKGFADAAAKAGKRVNAKATVNSGVDAMNKWGQRNAERLGTVGSVASNKGTTFAKEGGKNAFDAEHPEEGEKK